MKSSAIYSPQEHLFPWTNTFIQGKQITLQGVYQGANKITISSCNFEPIENQLGLQPVYSTNQSLTQKDWIKLIDKALKFKKIYDKNSNNL